MKRASAVAVSPGWRSSSPAPRGRSRSMRRLPAPSEHASQSAFFSWWPLFAQAAKIHDSLCYAVPNGGARHKAVAGKMKAEGVKRGVCDVNLDVARGGFHGLRLEFKRPGGKPTPEQEKHLYALRAGGYNALIVWSTEEAIRAVKAYLAPP